MEFYRTKVVRESNVKTTFITQYNGSEADTLKAGIKKALDLAAINQGDKLHVFTLDCYSFPQVWKLHSTYKAGKDLNVVSEVLKSNM